MAILFVGLLLRGGVPNWLAQTSDGMLANLSLMFVPAGVGVMLHAPLIANDWLAISVGLVVSTLATIAVTALAMQWLGGRSTPGGSGGAGEASARPSAVSDADGVRRP